MLLGTPEAYSNIRELAVAGGATDQQRVQSGLLNNGWIVFVWEDQSGIDSEVKYRLFNPAFSQLSTVRSANADAAGDQVDPVVAPTMDGGFAIAFASRPADGDYDVKFRRFDFTGAPIETADTTVNLNTAGSQQHPAVTVLSNGWLVVAFGGPGVDGQDLFYRRFDFSGTAIDTEDMPINWLGSAPIADGDQGTVAVSSFAAGGWVTTFEDRNSGDLFGVRFDNNGEPQTKPGGAVNEYYFLLNQATAFDQFEPSLAAFGDSKFAVAFNSDTNGTAASRRVFLQLFDSNGPNPAGEIIVGSTTERSQDPHVALISSTRLAVAWKTLENTGVGPVWSVYVQVFDLNGNPQGAPLFLHADQSLDRGRPYVIPWSDGGFAVSWETGGVGGSVAARTVAPTNVSPGVMSVFLSGDPESLNYQISFLGFPGECYELQAADALNSWTTILTTNAPTGSFVFSDLAGANTPYRFFQVKRKLSGNLNP